MLEFENQNIEFKQEYVPDIRKEVMGFANAEGGTVYVGVRKDGAVLGIGDPDGVMLQIVNSLKDSLTPDIMPFVRVNTVEIEEKQVIEIDVTTGTNRPYYLREKGLKPGGVYVRKGSSTQPMTEEGIREMILQNSGRSFDLCRSMNQELTFHTLQTEMQRRSIEIGPSQMRTLKLIGEDGLYTNLALLLSDQCETTTNLAAVFYRMRLIESYGTGIGKIERAYKACSFQPEFETAKGVFRVTLPNRNEEQESEAQEIENANNDISLDEQKNLIIQYARENGSITRKEVEDLIGAGTTKAFRLLKELCEVDKLEQKGSGKLSTYVIK